MKLYRTNQLVLKFSNNPEKLLNGISTNILDSYKNAFVDNFGKTIVTFSQLKINDEVLIVIEQPFYEKLLSHLEKFLKVSKVKLELQNYVVYFNLETDFTADHKLPTANQFIIPQSTGQLFLTSEYLPVNVSESEFILFRLKNNIPIQGTDYNNELLMNIDESFISFTKGCFLGQEVFARIKSRSKPPKKLIVKCEDDCTDGEKKIMTSKTLDPEANKIIGFVLVKNQ